MTLPASPWAAPVLMPVGAPTAAPVGVYHYPARFAPQATAAQPCAEAVDGPAKCGRLWATADFFYGATKGAWAPPLVTASQSSVPPGLAGALYSPATAVAFGGERVGNEFRPGLRAGVGYWFDDGRSRGVDASFFFLGETVERFAGASGFGGTTLARPLVLGATGQNVGLPVGGPFPGGVTASVNTFVIGGDVNYRKAMCDAGCGCDNSSGRLDLLVGYRYLHLGDAVDVWQAGGPGALPPVLPGAGGFVVHDSFRTRNHFHGPQVGVASVHPLGDSGLVLELLAKLALGVTVSEADVVGTARVPGLPPVPVGVLAGPSNAGAYDDAHFAVVPELGVKLGYNLGRQFRVTTGYSFLYWSTVQRAAEQIDLTVLAPGRPAFRDRTDDLWVQGWTVGAEWRY